MHNKITSIMHRSGSNRKLVVIGLVTALISIFLPLAGFAFVCIISAKYFPYGFSYFKKLLFSTLLLLIANALLYELFNLFGVTPQIQSIGVDYAVAGVVTGLLLPRHKRSTPLLDRTDIICTAIALVTFGALLFPVVSNGSTQKGYTTATLHLLSSGEDNASHFALFKYAYVHDSYAYRDSASHSGLISTLVVYPQGSEFTMSWLAKAVLGTKYSNNNGMLVKAYYVLCALAYSLLTLFILLFAGYLYEKSRGKITTWSSAFVFATGGLLLFVGPLLEILGRGFHSQVFAYICFIAALFLLTASEVRPGVKHKLLPVAVLVAGVCISWWYLVPVIAVPVLLYLYEQRVGLKRFASLWPVLLIALAGLYPVILSLQASIGANTLNAPGGVDIIATTTLGLYILGCLSIYLLRRDDRSRFRYAATSIVGWLLFTSLVAAYQLGTTHHFQYYYYKSLFTLIPIAMIIMIFGSLRVFDMLFARQTVRSRTLGAVGLVVSAVLLLIAVKPTYPQVYLHDWYNNPTKPDNYGLLLQSASSKTYKDVVFLGGCNTGEIYLYNRWAGALLLSESYERSRLNNAVLRNEFGTTAYYLKRMPNQDRTKIFVTKTCLAPEVERGIPSAATITKL